MRAIDDISYPENAVKIMSDEIIKNLLHAKWLFTDICNQNKIINVKHFPKRGFLNIYVTKAFTSGIKGNKND